MSLGKSHAESDSSLNTMRGTDHVAWTAYAALLEVLPSTDGATDEVECDYAGYARTAALTWSAPADGSSGARQVTNSIDATWPEVPEDVSAVGVALYDAPAGGTRRRIGMIPGGITFLSGKTPNIPAGALTVIED